MGSRAEKCRIPAIWRDFVQSRSLAVGCCEAAADMATPEQATDLKAIFEKLVHSSMDGILAFDKDGRYTVWNPALERIFGVTELERLGKEATDLCPFFRLTGGKNCYREALAGRSVVATDIPYVFAETGK